MQRRTAIGRSNHALCKPLDCDYVKLMLTVHCSTRWFRASYHFNNDQPTVSLQCSCLVLLRVVNKPTLFESVFSGKLNCIFTKTWYSTRVKRQRFQTGSLHTCIRGLFTRAQQSRESDVSHPNFLTSSLTFTNGEPLLWIPVARGSQAFKARQCSFKDDLAFLREHAILDLS